MRDVAVTEGDKVEAELALRRLGEHLRRQRPGRGRRRGRRRRRSTRWSPSTLDAYDVAAELRARRRPARVAALRAPGSRPGCATFLERRRLRRLHHELRGPRRAAPAARPGRAAADGRRLRLRRRGRLEDRRCCCARSRRWRRACPAAPRSWRTTPTTSAPAQRADPRRAHARGLPDHRRGAPPACEIHPLGIGGREDPVRLVFDAAPGPAVVVGIARPRRPVPPGGQRDRRGDRRTSRCRSCRSARAVWQPAPDLSDLGRGAGCTAGGPHHTVLSTAADEHRARPTSPRCSALELPLIDADTTTRSFRNELRWNQAYHRLAGGL